MSETRIENLTTTGIADALEEFQVEQESLEGGEVGISRWHNTNFKKYLGHYKHTPELKSKIDTYAAWIVGKGFEAEPETEMALASVNGNGKDTFNGILKNVVIIKSVGGDSYNEIINDEEGELLNLKPLNPEHMVHVIDEKGMIKSFEQWNKFGDGKWKVTSFEPEELLYIPRNRIGDEVHGTSMIESITQLLDSSQEALADVRIFMHRFAVPQRIWEADTDKKDKLSEVKEQINEAVKERENIIVPKGSLALSKDAGISPNANVNQLPWLEFLGKRISQATGVPDLISGTSFNITESSAKMEYFAWQQRVEEGQLEIEEQILTQLGIEIKLTFPARLNNDAFGDNPPQEVDGESEQLLNPPEIQEENAFEPNDKTAEVEGFR